MLGINDYWGFVAATLVFLMLPGPGTFGVLTSTGKGGLRAGFAALAGIIVGDWILMLLAVIGVAALLGPPQPRRHIGKERARRSLTSGAAPTTSSPIPGSLTLAATMPTR